MRAMMSLPPPAANPTIRRIVPVRVVVLCGACAAGARRKAPPTQQDTPRSRAVGPASCFLPQIFPYGLGRCCNWNCRTGRPCPCTPILFGRAELWLRNIRRGAPARAAPQPAVQPIEQQIDHRRRVKREDLRHQQAADDGDAERAAQLRCPVRPRSPAAPRRAAPPTSSSGSAGSARGTPRRSRARAVRPRWRSPSSAKSTSMMPFFFTMPISRMMPMKAMIDELGIERHAAPAARRGRPTAAWK